MKRSTRAMGRRTRRDYKRAVDFMRRIKKPCRWDEIVDFGGANLWRWSIGSYLDPLRKAGVVDKKDGLYFVKIKTRKPFLRVYEPAWDAE